MKLFTLSFLLVLFSFQLFSKTTTTIKDGNWANASTWDNGVPNWGDNAIINHTINLNTGVNLGSGDILVNPGANLIQSGTRNISIWDNTGSFTNYGTVVIRTLQGSGGFYNFGSLTLTGRIEINNPGTFESSGSINSAGNLNIWTTNPVIISGVMNIGGALQIGNSSSFENNANTSVTGNCNFNNGSTFVNNNIFSSTGNIWAGSSTTITNNQEFSANNYDGEAIILNDGIMNLNDINSAYNNGSITNTATSTLNLNGVIKIYGTTDVTNNGIFLVSSASGNSAIGGNAFTNTGRFEIQNNRVDLSGNSIDNYGTFKVHSMNGETVFNNYDTVVATGDIDDFYSDCEFYNHTNSYLWVDGKVTIWGKTFVNDGFAYSGGNIIFGSGVINGDNRNVFVTDGKVTNQCHLKNNGAFYCLSNDFLNDWSSSVSSTSCGHINVGCNDFIDRGSVNTMNIHGNYVKTGGAAPINMSTFAWLPCSDVEIEYYSIADGNWEDGNVCSGLCVWSLKQIYPVEINEYPHIYGRVTIDNNLITVNNTTTPQPISCDSLALKPLGFLTIDDEKSLTVNGDFIINSPQNTGATGSLVENGTLNVTEQSVVQRFITGSNWHYFGSPVDEFSGADFFQQNFYFYNEVNNDTWDADNIYGISGWTNPGTGTLNAEMQGYIYYYNDQMLEFNGNLNTGSKSVTLSYTDNNPTEPHFDGWNLISNPYPSSINWDDVVTTGIIDNCIYFYDDEGSSPYYNNYKYYIKGGGGVNPYPSISVNGATAEVPVAQAFFVRTTNNGQVFSLDNSVRIHSNQDFYKLDKIQHHNIIKMQLSSSNGIDETAIRFIDDATDGFDNQYDAIKMFSYYDDIPSFYTITQNQENLAINTLPADENRVVPLGFKAQTDGDYEIIVTNINFDNYTQVYLYDKYLNVKQNLFDKKEYEFETVAGNFTDRFQVIFGSSQTNLSTLEKFINIYSSKNLIYVENNFDNSKELSIKVFTADGKMIKSVDTYENTFIFEIYTPGVYIVNILSDNQVLNKKIIIY